MSTTREQMDRENWSRISKDILAGKLVIKDRSLAESVLIGLRHYRRFKGAMDSIQLISKARFKDSTGEELIKKLIPDWAYPKD